MIEKINERLMNNDDVEILNDMHPYDLIALYQKLSSDDQAYFLTLLNKETYAGLLSYLDPEEAVPFLERLSLEDQIIILPLLDPDDAADLIAEMPIEAQKAIIKGLGKENKAVALLKYEEEVAGSLMNNSFVTVSISDDVKTATKQVIKMAGDVSSIQTIFVTDSEGLYLGQMPLKTLLKAKPPLVVRDILTQGTTFKDTDSLDEVTLFMREYSEHDLAITNAFGVLVGVITASDVLEELHAEAIEDFTKLSALPEIDFKQGIFKSAFKRLPWLLGLLVLSLVIALITAQFETVIQATVALAFFQPLILDVGGDVASQTLAVTLIALNNDDDSIKQTARKEVISGLIIGAVISIVSFIITYLYGLLVHSAAPILLAAVVSLSLLVTVIIGFLFGLFVPVILNKLKVDPAVASGPFITTSIDILSLLVYFGLAVLIL